MLSVLTGLMLAAAPQLAPQLPAPAPPPPRASTANDAPWPLPDTRGADPDFICYAVLLIETGKMPQGSMMREGVTATIGVYVERLARRFPDAAALAQVARGFGTAFDGHVQELAAFGRPCAQRAGIEMDRVKDALAAMLPPPAK